MKIILLGCPGAGKGTQAEGLVKKYGLTHLSTGDLFRAEIAKGSPLGQKVQDYMKRGTLVPDEVVVEVVAAKLDDISGGWLLDGFPRTLPQAQALDGYLKSNQVKIDAVLYLAMEEDTVVSRLSGRRSCAKCKAVYNVATKPPKTEGKCDGCGGDLMQREDDKEATIRKRMMVFNDLTQPLVTFYKTECPFHEVDGSGSPGEVGEKLFAILDKVQETQKA